MTARCCIAALLVVFALGARAEPAPVRVTPTDPKPAETKPAATTPACPADALGTSRTLVVGTQDGPEIGLKSYPRTLLLADHEVVLTFDDGPGATTPAVLAALAHECVKATFFLIGRNAEAAPDIVKRELAAGHTLGHHTFSHPARTLRRMTPEAAEADIERGFKADDTAAYGTAGDDPRVPFFRFPGFADTPQTNAWLATRNIAVLGTDIWALDWLELSPQAELGFVMRRLNESKRGIILLHDTRRSTAQMLPAFLRALKAGGYHVVALVPGPGPLAMSDAPKGWTSETDRIIAEVFSRERHIAAGLRDAVMRCSTIAGDWPRLRCHRVLRGCPDTGSTLVRRPAERDTRFTGRGMADAASSAFSPAIISDTVA